MLRGYSEQESLAILEGWRHAIYADDVYGFGLSYRMFTASPLPRAHVLKLKGVFDNNSALHGQTLLGHYKILNPAEAAGTSSKIAVFHDIGDYGAYGAISRQLTGLGLKENYDFINYRDFWSLLAYYRYNFLLLNKIVGIFITSRCSLICRHCMHAVPYWADRHDKSLERLIDETEGLFKRADAAASLGIVGGEPLLSPALAPYLRYLCEKYRHRVGTININTNGFTKPSPELLAVCREYPVRLLFSDYSASGIGGYHQRFAEILKILEANGIEPHHQRLPAWQIPTLTPEDAEVMGGLSPADMKNYFATCSHPGAAYQNGFFYPCTRAAHHAYRLGKEDSGATDISALSAANQADRLKLLMLFLGYTEKGYLDRCRQCPSPRLNLRAESIPVAEQMAAPPPDGDDHITAVKPYKASASEKQTGDYHSDFSRRSTWWDIKK